MSMNAPRFDLFDADTNPAFGIPVVGNALNYDQLIAGWLADLLTDPNSAAGQMARDQGIVHSWQARNDISEPVKLGVELASGILPDLALGAVTGGAGLAGILPRYGARLARVGGLVGQLGKTEHALASTKVMEPAADFLFKQISKGLKKTPGVKTLLEPSAVGVAAKDLHEASSLGQSLKRTGFGGLNYGDIPDAVNNVNLGAITRDDFANVLRISKPEADKLIDIGGKIDLEKVARKATNEDEFIAGMLKDYDKAIAPAAGTSIIPKSVSRPYQQGLAYLKEGMLSGPTFVQNAIDIAGKSFIEGGFSGLRRAVSALPEVAKDAKRSTAKMRAFSGQDTIPAELGVLDVLPGMTGRVGKEKGLANASNMALGLGGAVAGALSGNPVGVALGAAQMVGMKYGFKFNTGVMSALESAARQTHFLDGVTEYFTKQAPKYFKPQIRDAALAEIDDIAANAGVQRELTDFVTNKHFLVTPEEVGAEARRLMGNNPSSDRIEQLYREVHNEAKQAGIEYSNKINFDYTNDTKLTSYLRNWSPFPVWPLHNVPYYAKQAIKYPAIPALIGSAAAKSQETQDYYGLPSRFNDKVAVGSIPGGTIFADPMAPLSIAGQFTEPPVRFKETDANGNELPPNPVDQFLDLASYVGLGPNPLIQNALMATGLANRGREVSDFIPWTRVTRGVGQALTGQNIEPENILKAPLEGIRAAVAPEAVPESTYQQYLVRKKLAEMSVATTGKTWQNSPEFTKAIAEGPTNALYQQAQKMVGQEQALTTLARRFTGVQPTYLPNEELAIRNAGQRAPALPENPTSADFAARAQAAPLSEGYKGIYGSQNKIELQAKVNVFFDLPTSAARTRYLKDNPDVAAYLEFATQSKAAKSDGSIDAYLRTVAS